MASGYLVKHFSQKLPIPTVFVHSGHAQDLFIWLPSFLPLYPVFLVLMWLSPTLFTPLLHCYNYANYSLYQRYSRCGLKTSARPQIICYLSMISTEVKSKYLETFIATQQNLIHHLNLIIKSALNAVWYLGLDPKTGKEHYQEKFWNLKSVHSLVNSTVPMLIC